MISTLFSIIIMGLSITGYIDLSLSEHQFRDMIEKDINGELTCIGSNKTNFKNVHNENIRNTRHLISPVESGFILLTWNCSHAAEVLSNCKKSFENVKQENLGNYIKYKI